MEPNVEHVALNTRSTDSNHIFKSLHQIGDTINNDQFKPKSDHSNDFYPN